MRGKFAFLPCLFIAGLFAAENRSPGNKAESKTALREKLMRAPPDCMLIAENAARTIHYGEAAEDEVMSEWRTLCGENELTILYELSGKLDTIGVASPEINDRLWSALNRQRISRSTSYKLPEYHRLLAQRAAASKPRSTDGKLLQTWFQRGRSAFLSELKNTSGGKLHEFAARDSKDRESAMSMTLAANAGAWLPMQNLSRLGEHPTLGFLFAIGVGNLSFGMAVDFRFLNAPADYLYYDLNTNTVQPTRTFFGLFMGLDMRWEFLKFGPMSLLAAGALGYDLISHRAVQRYSGLRPAYSDSFNMNGGLALRYYFSVERSGFIELDARAHRVNYVANGAGGDDLSGYYFTAVLAAGYRLTFDQ